MVSRITKETTLNDAHPSVKFTMKTAANNRLPFVGMVIFKSDHCLKTCIYIKKTNEGLLLHYQNHVGNRYKRSLLKTMPDRVNRLSSSPDLFSQERKDLKTMFLKVKYLDRLIDSTITSFYYQILLFSKPKPKMHHANRQSRTYHPALQRPEIRRHCTHRPT